jgi:hypothetical protein
MYCFYLSNAFCILCPVSMFFNNIICHLLFQDFSCLLSYSCSSTCAKCIVSLSTFVLINIPFLVSQQFKIITYFMTFLACSLAYYFLQMKESLSVPGLPLPARFFWLLVISGKLLWLVVKLMSSKALRKDCSKNFAFRWHDLFSPWTLDLLISIKNTHTFL